MINAVSAWRKGVPITGWRCEWCGGVTFYPPDVLDGYCPRCHDYSPGERFDVGDEPDDE